MKYFNYISIGLLSLLVIMMLTSFILRISNPIVDSSLNDSIKITKQERIQVNILNACGKSGLAGKTNEYLRNFKFDVVEIGNYDEYLENSIVIDRLGDYKSAKKVAYAIGVPDSLIFTRIDSSLFVRTSIIIGNDYKKLSPFN